jgi:hypothetical protein
VLWLICHSLFCRRRQASALSGQYIVLIPLRSICSGDTCVYSPLAVASGSQTRWISQWKTTGPAMKIILAKDSNLLAQNLGRLGLTC